MAGKRKQKIQFTQKLGIFFHILSLSLGTQLLTLKGGMATRQRHLTSYKGVQVPRRYVSFQMQ